MKWDLAFYVRNSPVEYRFHDRHFRMADVTDEHVESLLRGGMDGVPGVPEFFAKARRQKLTVILFRVSADTAEDSLTLAMHQLDGFVDGLAVLLDRDLPEICSVVAVRREGEANSQYVRMVSSQWARFQPNDPTLSEQWRERNRNVLDGLMPFFDIASGIHAQKDTSLSRQLLYSMKMYRAGAETGDFGLEFICKWSGLEGLVCGGEKSGKHKLLQERLSSLMPEPVDETTELVRTLWGFRNQAVHEALAFQSDYLEGAPSLAIWIEPVERLFLAVVTFALAHLDKTDAVQTLWPYVTSFQLPLYATLSRPSEMARVAATKVRFNVPLVGEGEGRFFDAAFTLRPDAENPL